MPRPPGLEDEILYELRQVTERPALRKKDILRWSLTKADVEDRATPKEDVIYCPSMGVWCLLGKE